MSGRADVAVRASARQRRALTLLRGGVVTVAKVAYPWGCFDAVYLTKYVEDLAYRDLVSLGLRQQAKLMRRTYHRAPGMPIEAEL